MGVYTSNPNGTGERQIIGQKDKLDGRTLTYFGGLSWYPGGDHISFVAAHGNGDDVGPMTGLAMYLKNVDGSSLNRLFEFPRDFGNDTGYNVGRVLISELTWSNNGDEVAFVARDRSSIKLYAVRRDGSVMRELAVPLRFIASRNESYEWTSGAVSWSRDDSEVLFSLFQSPIAVVRNHISGTLYVANADGTGFRILGEGVYARWSPDGIKVANVNPYAGVDRHGGPGAILHTFRTDGTDVRVLTEVGLDGTIMPVGADRWRRSADPAQCSAGTVILDPMAHPGLVQDCETLLTLRDRLTGSAKLNWDSDRPIAEWTGVGLGTTYREELDENRSQVARVSSLQTRVRSIFLVNRGLKGVLPEELSNLAKLRSLNLRGNELVGPVPAKLGYLTNLEFLVLGENSLTGEIPGDIQALEKLVVLDLGVNHLSGSMPPELGNLNNLTKLNLGRNQLTGNIPAELGNLTKLKELYLESNRFNGIIPSELGGITNLMALNLGNNELNGSIPTELGNLKSLEELSLGVNQLSGIIPPELGRLKNLKALGLQINELTGSIPTAIGTLSALETLNLYSNRLSGPIPLELGNLLVLRVVHLEENHSLVGCLPSGFDGRVRVHGYQEPEHCGK